MFINNHRHCWPVRLQCHVLQVSASGYYAWLKRPEPQLSDDERKLVRAMREIDEKSNHTFGSRRMYKELRRGNLVAGRHKMRRLMREDGIRVKRTPRRAWCKLPFSISPWRQSLNRNFTVTTEHRQGSRHHLCADQRWLCVLGGGDGFVLASHHWLASVRDDHATAHHHGTLEGLEEPFLCHRHAHS